MPFAITEWNLNPNRNWYVKLADAGTDISVKLYPTQADAAANTNLVAEGTAVFGTGSETLLIATGSLLISLFNDALLYHLKVSGADADTAKTFHIKPFVDIPDINHNVYRSEALIQKKALAEINAHTHTAKIRSIGIANHNPLLRTDDVINIQSTMRSLNVLATVSERLISGTPDELIDQIETVEYLDLTHG
jgi:hypothetical protein